jgi:hypothetical protein
VTGAHAGLGRSAVAALVNDIRRGAATVRGLARVEEDAPEPVDMEPESASTYPAAADYPDATELAPELDVVSLPRAQEDPAHEVIEVADADLVEDLGQSGERPVPESRRPSAVPAPLVSVRAALAVADAQKIADDCRDEPVKTAPTRDLEPTVMTDMSHLSDDAIEVLEAHAAMLVPPPEEPATFVSDPTFMEAEAAPRDTSIDPVTRLSGAPSRFEDTMVIPKAISTRARLIGGARAVLRDRRNPRVWVPAVSVMLALLTVTIAFAGGSEERAVSEVSASQPAQPDALDIPNPTSSAEPTPAPVEGAAITAPAAVDAIAEAHEPAAPARLVAPAVPARTGPAAPAPSIDPAPRRTRSIGQPPRRQGPVRDWPALPSISDGRVLTGAPTGRPSSRVAEPRRIS